jgi:hypothetical protein
VARVDGTKQDNTEFWLGSLKKRDHLEDLGINGRIITTRVLKEHRRKLWIGVGKMEMNIRFI